MGLFKKKEEFMVKVSECFSAEDLQKIKDVIEPKYKSGSYKKQEYMNWAAVLLEVAEDPDAEFSNKKWEAFGDGILFSAGAFTKVEHELAPILKSAVKKYHEKY